MRNDQRERKSYVFMEIERLRSELSGKVHLPKTSMARERQRGNKREKEGNSEVVHS